MTFDIEFYSKTLDKTIKAQGTEPELAGEDHITTRTGRLEARLNEERHMGADDWAGIIHLPGPLRSGT